MRVKDGRWICSWCGAVIDVPPNTPWRTEITGAGGEQNARVVIVGGEEVHRCTGPGSAAASPSRPTASALG